MSDKPWRLFVGAFPPAEVVRELDRQIEEWKPQLKSFSAKWVTPERIHLTLCFLGNVAPDRVPDLAERLREGATSMSPAELEITKLGCFPNVRRPRVVWAGVGGEVKELLSIQAKVASACRMYVEKPDDKPFAAHLTIARVKKPVAHLGEIVVRESGRSFGVWELKDILLMRSEVGNEGSKYTVLESFALGGRN